MKMWLIWQQCEPSCDLCFNLIPARFRTTRHYMFRVYATPQKLDEQGPDPIRASALITNPEHHARMIIRNKMIRYNTNARQIESVARRTDDGWQAKVF